jgi:hypothetical protein
MAQKRQLLHIALDEADWIELKVMAARRRATVSDIVRRLIQREIQREGRKKTA